MTDRIRTLTIVLDEEYRTDDAQVIVGAIQMIRGVSAVMLGEPVDPNDYYNRQAIAIKYSKALNDFAYLMVMGKDVSVLQKKD